MAMLLVTPLTACRSTKIITIEKTHVPIIDFPAFPIAETMTDNKDGTVTVPSEWIVRLEEYHIRIEEAEKTYEDVLRLYKEDMNDKDINYFH